MIPTIPIFLSLFSYLIGSISASIIICKALNLPDPRTVGSNNAGSTNVLRIAGKKVAIITLLIDVAKGIIPIIIASHYFGLNLAYLSIIGFFALIGHIFPIFFGFKGGKGVATFVGVLLALNLYSGLSFLAIWLFVAKVLKKSSLSALIATFFTPIYFYFFTQNKIVSLIIFTISIVIFITHKNNILRLINKEEENINAR